MQALQSYPWPKNVTVKLQTITIRDRSNAFAELVSDTNPTSDLSTDSELDRLPVRVRVSNSSDSAQHDFKVGWGNATGGLSATAAVPIQVPPGTSRVVSLPYPPNEQELFASLVLSGDSEPFDNTRYVANAPAQSLKLLFVSDSKAKPEQSAAFFFSKVPLDDARRTVELLSVTSSDLPTSINRDQVPMVVVQNEVSDAAFRLISQYAADGGQLLWMLDSEGNQQGLELQLRQLLKHDSLKLSLVSDNDYTMWSKIDFEHPLFAPFADPRFNDFTKIRFWKHWQLSSLPIMVRRLQHTKMNHQRLWK